MKTAVTPTYVGAQKKTRNARFWVPAFAGMTFLLSAHFVSAQAAWRIERFRANITVQADGTVEVRETIEAEFLTERHGIYRTLPTRGVDTEGKPYRLDVKLLGVTRDGASEKVSASRSGDSLVWRIGREDVTMRGSHAYVIAYAVVGAIGRFEKFDELYWNVTGGDWDVPLPAATAVVQLPEGVEAMQSGCYTGAYGSTVQDCQIIDAAGQVAFMANADGSPLTVSVGWPKGLVAEAKPSLAASAWVPWLPLLLPIAVFAGMYLLWRKHGDDPALPAVVTQFEAPWNLAPAEVGVVMRHRSDRIDLPATLVDLAVRGFVVIEEKETPGLLAALSGNSKDHVFVLVRALEGAEGLKPFEHGLLEAVFGPNPPAGTRVPLSSLKGRFHMHVREFDEAVAEHLTAEGFFEKNPRRAQAGYAAFGTISFFAAWFLFAPAPVWALALAVSGVIVLAFAHFMSKWTAKGHAAAAHLRGYREFISKVEKHRAPWMENQGMFEKVLPYAILFGLATKWAAAFESLRLPPPSWYHVASLTHGWSASVFGKDMSGLSQSFVAAATPPRSSGSGSGGGGFSGGGGGGGGGGSW